MHKTSRYDPIDFTDSPLPEPAVDKKEVESKTEGDQFLNLGRERVGLINIRHHPKKGNKSDRY